MTYTYITHLQCSGCGRQYPHQKVQTFCTECNSPLLAVYDLKAARGHVKREDVSQRPRGMWRWHELLPVLKPENEVILGEGDTPLIRLPNIERQLDHAPLYVKDESGNPTGSFKARGLAA